MKENKVDDACKSFPVKISALKVNWILDQESKYGKNFLSALINSENLDIFECEYVILLTEYLYKHYKNRLIWVRLPFYIIQMVVYYSCILINE